MGKPKPRMSKRKSRTKLGARAYKNYTNEMLEIAVESVANKSISSRDAEKQFSIPRRTIINKLKRLHANSVGSPTRLTNDEEEKLLNVLIASGEFGSPLTKFDLRMLVDSYLKKNGKGDVFNGKLPGLKWVNSFLSRHSDKLTVRAVQNISSSRAEKGADEILNYFQNLKKTLEGIPPSNILNYDETNCSDNPGSEKAIFKRGVKYPERILNSTKGCISIMFTGTADGECLPPYVVYKAEHLYDEWILNGPNTARYNCTKSGWFDSANFEEYFRKVILDWAKRLSGPKVVIGDNLSSHLSPDVIELCEKYEIKFVFLPPSSTHLTQPLDVAFFAPLKKAWRKILLQYKIENPHQKTLNKKHFPPLLKKLMEVAEMQSDNIKSGFRATGIYPLNPREVLKRIPDYNTNIDDYSIDKALLDYLKQTRAPNPMKTSRNKKINVEPGRSVSLSDFDIDYILASKNKTKGKEPKKGQSDYATRKLKLKKVKSKTEQNLIKKQTNEDEENEIEIEAFQFEEDRQKMEIVKMIESKEIPQNAEKDHNYTQQNKICKKNKDYETKRLNLHKLHFEAEFNKEENAENSENYIYLDENTGVLREREIEILRDRDRKLTKERDYDEINQYEEEIHIKVDKKPFMGSNSDHSVTTTILDETTGIMLTKVVSTVIIENPRSPVLGKNFTPIQKSSTVDIEFTQDIDIVSNRGKGCDKENIWYSDTESNSYRSLIQNVPKPRFNVLKKKSKSAKRSEKRYSDSSTTTEEIVLSVHSNSDLDDVNLEGFDSDIMENLINIEEDDDVRRKVNAKETEIFNDIERLKDLESDEEDANTDDIVTLNDSGKVYKKLLKTKKSENEEDNKVQLAEKNQDENKDTILNNFEIGDTVLVKYYLRKFWKNYVGVITEINEKREEKYKISYFKTIHKGCELKFVKPKRPDTDYISDLLIVKHIKLLQINEKPVQFILYNKYDETYF